MRKNVTILALVLLACLSACNRGHMKEVRELDVEDQFSLLFPANFRPCNDLHEFAPLQYADERGGYFLMGIQEPKEDIAYLKEKYSLGDYAHFVETTIGSAFDTVHVSERDTLAINGMQCQTADMYVAVTDEQSPMEVYYHLSVFESNSHFYQLIGWSHRDRQSVFRAAAVAMDQSFHECGDALEHGHTASALVSAP